MNIFVDARLIEELLWQEESEQLDFKEQQYPFSGATDEQKASFLRTYLVLRTHGGKGKLSY